MSGDQVDRHRFYCWKFVFSRNSLSSEQTWMRRSPLSVGSAWTANQSPVCPSLFPPNRQLRRWNYHQRPWLPLNAYYEVVRTSSAIILPSGELKSVGTEKTRRTNKDASVNCYWRLQKRPAELHANDCWLRFIPTVHDRLTCSNWFRRQYELEHSKPDHLTLDAWDKGWRWDVIWRTTI